MRNDAKRSLSVGFAMLWLAAGIGIWLIPWSDSGWAWLDSVPVRVAVRLIADMAAVGGMMDTVKWGWHEE